MIIPYSDTIGLFFLALIVMVGLETYRMKSTKHAFYAVFGYMVVAYIGYKIKPTTIFVSVLLLLIIVIKMMKMKKGVKLKSGLAFILIVGLLHGLFLGNYVIKQSEKVVFSYNYYPQTKDELEFPMTHYLMMVMQKAGKK